MKKIGPSAFVYQNFHGELILPEGLEYMSASDGLGSFTLCSFSGSLVLPSSLKSMMVPSGSFSGTITVPEGVNAFRTQDNSGWGLGFTVDNGILELHEGMTELYIRGCRFAGELVVPSTIRQLEDEALADNKFRKIILNDNLKIIGDRVMADNSRLESVVLSQNIARIPVSCFENCTMLNSITIPANVDIIEKRAFANCSGLNSILCEAIEPPAVGEDAFYNVSKDNFTLEVPKGSVDKYKEADGWKEFKRIAEYSNFVCRPAQANALNNAHSEDIVLNADGAWTVTSCPDWVHLSKTSGTGKTALQLTFLEMSHGAGNREARIVFDMDGIETYCDVKQYDYEQEEDSYLALQTHSIGNGIDLIFMGDGWTGEQISNGEYLAMVNEQMDYFFGVEPYESHREYFNVYVTFPLSQEKGVNTMNTYVNNRFGTLYGYDGKTCTSNQLLTETDEVISYAVEKTPLTEGNKNKAQIILIPNSNEYEGVTYFDGDCALSLCPPSIRPYPQDTRGVVQHEACGHGFGKLGDENIAKQAWATPDVLNVINGYHGQGWYKNLATTSKMSQVPWAEFIFDSR
ncbi:MAG: leucine-rich repeat protein, partial [Prevotella sp.]